MTESRNPHIGPLFDDWLKEEGISNEETAWESFIAVDPHVMHGAVCFRGTRTPISAVLDNLADGATPEEILDQYSGLRPEHPQAAVSYAAKLARD